MSLIERLGIIAIILALTAVCMLREASADCGGVLPNVLQTIPPDGATGVPTDIAFVVFSAARPDEAVTLDGEELSTDDELPTGANAAVWRPNAALEPNTTHELILQFSQPDGPVSHKVTFTTGSGLAGGSAPSAPDVNGHSILTDADELVRECWFLAATTGCADTGEPVFVRFETTATPVGWFVSSAVRGFDQHWPATCGAPSWDGYLPDDGCFELRVFDSAGRLSEPTEYCLPMPSDHPDAGFVDAGDGGIDGGDDTGGHDIGNDGSASETRMTGEGGCATPGSTPSHFPLSMFWVLVALFYKTIPRAGCPGRS